MRNGKLILKCIAARKLGRYIDWFSASFFQIAGGIRGTSLRVSIVIAWMLMVGYIIHWQLWGDGSPTQENRCCGEEGPGYVTVSSNFCLILLHEEMSMLTHCLTFPALLLKSYPKFRCEFYPTGVGGIASRNNANRKQEPFEFSQSSCVLFSLFVVLRSSRNQMSHLILDSCSFYLRDV
jgi:hypothetical protein